MSLIQPGTLLRCTKEVKIYDKPECLFWACPVCPLEYVLFLEFVLSKRKTITIDFDYSGLYNSVYSYTAAAKVLHREQVLYIRGVSGPWFFENLGEGVDHKHWSQEAMNLIFQQVSTNIKVYFELMDNI